jgi:hypothetical protein
MKKLLLVILAIAMTAAFTMPAEATQSRVAAMGGYGRYLEDDFNIFEWPATLPAYSNMVWIELMSAQYWLGASCPYNIWCDNIIPAIGASYALGEDGKLGTLAMFFHEASEPLHPLWNTPWWPEWSTGPINAGPSYNKFHVMYGYATEGLSFGIALTRADDFDRFEDGYEEEESAGYTTVSAGVRFDVGESAYMDVNFELGMASFADSTYGGYAVTEDANMIYGIKARMFYEWNETITWIPYFGFTSYDFSAKSDYDGFTDNYWGDKGMGFEFGIGANIAVNEDNLLLFAIEPYSYFKREPSAIPEGVDGDFTSTATIMPRFIMGLETDIKDWLTFRMGGVHELMKVEDKSCNEDVDGVCTETWSDFNYYMGLGFHVGDWDIDCVLNNSTPFHLGYWLTGYGTYTGEEESPIWIVSGKYHF